MKKIILLCCLMMLPLFANAQEETTTNKVDRILITSISDGSAYYWFFRQGGWGAPSCPSSRYAIIQSTNGGAKEMLELVTAAKIADRTVLFRGNCGDPGKFVINYMWMN